MTSSAWNKRQNHDTQPKMAIVILGSPAPILANHTNKQHYLHSPSDKDTQCRPVDNTNGLLGVHHQEHPI
jgi:hypothetical protein